MTDEIYEDVLEEEPKDSKEDRKWEKRLRKSIGWFEPDIKYMCACDEKGKTWKGAEIKKKIVWEVSLGDGAGFTCDKQIEAEILSYLVQINARLKWIEKRLKK